MQVEPIRVQIHPQEASKAENPRQEFWAPLRNSTNYADRSIPQFEAKLRREFGGALRSHLLRELSEPLRLIEREIFPDRLGDFEHFFFRFVDQKSERDWYRYQFAEVFTKFLEMRRDVFRESPALQKAQERVAAAGAVIFSTGIASYSSANLDVFTGSFAELNKAFENNFDSFRVFLEAFVPPAFAEVFDEDFADRFEFAVSIPNSFQRAFEEGYRANLPHVQTLSSTSQASAVPSSRERAEWLWRLANGSLLIPFLLSILVMYFGLRMLMDIRNTQSEALKPVIEHQLELLKEDRARFRESNHELPAATPANSVNNNGRAK